MPDLTVSGAIDSLLALANPSVISYLRINADNTASFLTAAQLRTDIGTLPTGGSQAWTINGNPVLTLASSGSLISNVNFTVGNSQLSDTGLYLNGYWVQTTSGKLELRSGATVLVKFNTSTIEILKPISGIGNGLTIITVAGTSYTLDATNCGNNTLIRFTSATAVAVSVATGLAITPAYPFWNLQQAGTGVVTVGGSGITAEGSKVNTAGQWESMSVFLTGTNTISTAGGVA